jgi:hypothetical protein
MVKMEESATYEGGAEAAVKYIRDYCIETFKEVKELIPVLCDADSRGDSRIG